MRENEVRVSHWTGRDQPAEVVLRQHYVAEGMQPYRWSNGPGYASEAHAHPYHKVLYVVSGSITFILINENKQLVLEAGDRLDMPPATAHAAVVGPHGVVCLEAQRDQ